MDLSKFPDLEKWRQEARQELINKNPSLRLPENQEKLNSLTDTFVLLSRQDLISKIQPNLANDIQELSKLKSQLPELSSVNSSRIENNLS
jgi:hypothetical protein